MGSLIKSLAGLFKGVKRPWQVRQVWKLLGGVVGADARARTLTHTLNPSTPSQTTPKQITGIASTSDYHEYLPTGNDYRKFAPG